MGNGGFPVLEMTSLVHVISGFAVASPETAVIKQKDRKALSGKGFGIGWQSESSFRAESVGHDHHRRTDESFRKVKLSSAAGVSAEKIRGDF
jgi:hypothetical protein